MGLFRNSQVDEIAAAEHDLTVAVADHGSKSRQARLARAQVLAARNGANIAENMQASYESATGDKNSRDPYSGVRGLFS